MRAAINADLASFASTVKLAFKLTLRRAKLRRGLRNLARGALMWPLLGCTRVAHEQAITVHLLAHVADSAGLRADAADGVEERFIMSASLAYV